jgi:hypothetical protein
VSNAAETSRTRRNSRRNRRSHCSGSTTSTHDDQAISKGLITPGQPAQKLKHNPDVIKQLSDYANCVNEIRSLNVRVHPVTTRQIRKSEGIRSSYGMMTNDSVTVAIMSSYGITGVASLDSDLQRAPGIILYQRTDVP